MDDRPQDPTEAPSSVAPEPEPEPETDLGAGDDEGGPSRRWWWIAAAAIALVAIALPVWWSFTALERVPVDTDAARQRLAERAATGADDEPVPDGGAATATGAPEDGAPASPTPAALPPPGSDAVRSFLVIGSDERAAIAGSRADVLVVGLLPADGGDPVMFSLPRDLWVDDPCRSGQQRINAAYNGCPGVANGFELTSIVVEDFTGIEIDNVVAIDFDGFKEIIDAVGGVEICVDHPVRDRSVRVLSLPAGCSMADGATALGWVRARKLQEQVDGQWRDMAGVNDLTRNRHQQDIMLQLLRRVGSFETVTNLSGFARGVSDSVTLGAGLNLLDGARLAWSMRGRAGDVERFAIPIEDFTTGGGAQVLVPTEPFATTFEREVGESLASFVDG